MNKPQPQESGSNANAQIGDGLCGLTDTTATMPDVLSMSCRELERLDASSWFNRDTRPDMDVDGNGATTPQDTTCDDLLAQRGQALMWVR